MTIAPVIKRRIEKRMGVRELGKRSSILTGVIEDAERRDTMDHFTVLQVKRLSAALDMNLFEVLGQESSEPISSSLSDAYEYLSDAALAFLIETSEIERSTGYWSDAANADPPPYEVSELLEAGVMAIVSGHAVVAPRISASLALFSTSPPPAIRMAQFSKEFAAHVTSLRP